MRRAFMSIHEAVATHLDDRTLDANVEDVAHRVERKVAQRLGIVEECIQAVREVGRRPGYYSQGRDHAATALVLRRDLT